MTLSITVFNLKPLRAVIKRSEAKKRGKVKADMRALAKRVKRTMKSKIPSGTTGNLRKSVTSELTGSGDTIGMEVGPSSRKKGQHAFLVEEGTTSRTRKSGGSTGSTTGVGYAQKTLDAMNIGRLEKQLSRSMFNLGRGK